VAALGVTEQFAIKFCGTQFHKTPTWDFNSKVTVKLCHLLNEASRREGVWGLEVRFHTFLNSALVGFRQFHELVTLPLGKYPFDPPLPF
jgi:hypothetical protein